ncbi:MAG TPA: histidine phosphatase family protein [Roseiflexaceae bacterium]|nr:histidine phosphatase family protein [Roseiflexaceae bacterium]
MRTLLLIKHAMPQIVDNGLAHTWQLSPAGRASCIPLAERLRPYAPATVVTSREPKAAQTGQLTAEQLGLACHAADNLHEHDRSGVEWMGDQAFQSAVMLFFRQPEDLVFGRETASAAGRRFAAALDNVLAAYPTGNLAVVAHGTVITLFVARHNRIDPYGFWKRLGLPSIVALQLPDFKLLGVEETISPTSPTSQGA